MWVPYMALLIFGNHLFSRNLLAIPSFLCQFGILLMCLLESLEKKLVGFCIILMWNRQCQKCRISSLHCPDDLSIFIPQTYFFYQLKNIYH